MKKRISAALLAVAIAIAMTACGNGEKTKDETTQVSEAAEKSFDSLIEEAKGTVVTFYG